MSAGRTMARAFERLPRVTREAAVREAAVAAVGLLKIDLMEVLVSGWREHRDIFTAARRTLDMPGSKELVGLAPHRISTVQQPAVGILVDGHRVHTLQLGLSIIFEVTGLVAGIHAGRLAAIHAGRGELGVALTVHELEVLTKRTHLELPGVKSLQRGFRLLPASAYPDEPHGHAGGQHPAGQHPADQPGAAVTAAAHFPGVDLMDGHVQSADLNDAAPHSAGPHSGPALRRAAFRRPRRRANPGRTYPYRAARHRASGRPGGRGASEQRRVGPFVHPLVAEVPDPARPHPHPLSPPHPTPPPPLPLMGDFMIAGSFGVYAAKTARDHDVGSGHRAGPARVVHPGLPAGPGRCALSGPAGPGRARRRARPAPRRRGAGRTGASTPRPRTRSPRAPP